MNRRQLYKYKGDRCAYCGLSVEEMVERYDTFNRMFEFNHIDPNEKHPNYDNIIRRVISNEQLDEIDKCILLCTKCHGIIHAQNITRELEIIVKIGSRKISQRFTGQLIIDKVEQKTTFLTNELVLVIPYRVQLGEEEPGILIGKELAQDNYIPNLLKNIAHYKTVKIYEFDRQLLLVHMEYIQDNAVEIKLNIRFPVWDITIRKEKGGAPTNWIRRGFALSREGEIKENGTLNFTISL